MGRKGKAVAFTEQLERIHRAAGTRTQEQLAAFFGIRQSSVADAKKRQSIPAEWLLKLLRQKGVSPEWIESGQEPRLLGPADGREFPPPAPERIVEVHPPEECTTQELVTEIVRRSLRIVSYGS